MKPEPLTLEEMAVIHDPKDMIYFEIIKGCSYDELKGFDVYVASNMKHYIQTQLPWLAEDKYLLGMQLQHQPSGVEFAEYLEQTHECIRFKAFYVLKYPHMVVRVPEKKKEHKSK